MRNKSKSMSSYKITAIGEIPVDWDVTSLGQCGSFSKGKGISNNEKTEKGIPCVTYGEIYTKHNILIKEFHSFIAEGSAHNSQRLNKNDILFAGSGETLDEIGKCVAFTKDIEAYAGGDIVIYHPTDFDSIFLSYVLNSNWITKFKRKLGQGHSVVHIYSSGLKKLYVPVPPIQEQGKISSILSIWDCSEEHLKKLITAKKNLKKALMQQILTGKKRFKEFVKSKETQDTRFGLIPADWGYPQVKEIADEVSARNDNGNDKTVLSCSKYDGLVESLKYFGKKVFSDDTSNYKVVRRNQFAYPANHIEEGSIGMLDFLDEGIVSPIYTVFEVDAKKAYSPFLYKLFKTELYRHIFAVNTNASVNRRGSMRWKQFALIHVPLPPLDEQKKISDCIDSCGDETKLLERKLEALQTQKRGLMQKLLTGKVRVKV
jgi:type I restriction enzyme S subunit